MRWVEVTEHRVGRAAPAVVRLRIARVWWFVTMFVIIS